MDTRQVVYDLMDQLTADARNGVPSKQSPEQVILHVMRMIPRGATEEELIQHAKLVTYLATITPEFQEALERLVQRTQPLIVLVARADIPIELIREFTNYV